MAGLCVVPLNVLQLKQMFWLLFSGSDSRGRRRLSGLMQEALGNDEDRCELCYVIRMGFCLTSRMSAVMRCSGSVT